jgi:hypothetical protein
MALCVFEKEKEKEKEKLRCLGRVPCGSRTWRKLVLRRWTRSWPSLGFAAGVCEGIFHFRAGKSV